MADFSLFKYAFAIASQILEQGLMALSKESL